MIKNEREESKFLLNIKKNNKKSSRKGKKKELLILNRQGANKVKGVTLFLFFYPLEAGRKVQAYLSRDL